MGNMLVGIFMGAVVCLLLFIIAISGIFWCSYLIWTSIGSLLGPTPDYSLDTLGLLCGSVALLIVIAMFSGIFNLGA